MSPSTDSRETREFASEIKFLLRPQLAAQVRDWARARLQSDPNAGGEAGDGYQITSLYFDTAQFDVFHRRGSFGRSKYRIRRYGAGTVAFLERKLKSRGLLIKRRSIVPLEELERLSGAKTTKPWVGAWFQRRLSGRSLNPVCQISYRRTARVAMTPFGPIRLTLDENLRASATTGLCFVSDEGELILKDQIILELKFRYAMPTLFKYLVEEFALTPRAFSKYRLAASSLGLANETTTGLREKLQREYA